MHVIAPLRQVPARLRTILASTIAAMIEIDDLRNIRQGRVGRLVDRVGEPGTTMQEQQCRPFPHGWTVWDQFCSFTIEEQQHPVDEYPHGQSHLRTSVAANRRTIRMPHPRVCSQPELA